MKPGTGAAALLTLLLIAAIWLAEPIWITGYDNSPRSPATPSPQAPHIWSCLGMAGIFGICSISIDTPRSLALNAYDKRDGGFSSEHLVSISMEGVTVTVTVTTTVTRAALSPQSTAVAATSRSEELEPRLPGAAALSYVAVAIIFGLIGFILGILASIRMGASSCTRRSRRV